MNSMKVIFKPNGFILILKRTNITEVTKDCPRIVELMENYLDLYFIMYKTMYRTFYSLIEEKQN